MNLRDRKVGIVGAPRSGNRIIAHMLQAHGFVAEVRHYGSDAPFRSGGYAERVVWPIRDFACWLKSCTRDLAILPTPLGVLGATTPEDLYRVHFDHTARTLTEHLIPCLPISYERLVRDPELVGRRILAWASAPEEMPKWQGWGVEIHDGNAKHREATT